MGKETVQRLPLFDIEPTFSTILSSEEGSIPVSIYHASSSEHLRLERTASGEGLLEVPSGRENDENRASESSPRKWEILSDVLCYSLAIREAQAQ